MQFSKNAGHLSHFAGRGTSDENAGLSLRMRDGWHVCKECVRNDGMRFNVQTSILTKSLVASQARPIFPTVWSSAHVLALPMRPLVDVCSVTRL